MGYLGSVGRRLSSLLNRASRYAVRPPALANADSRRIITSSLMLRRFAMADSSIRFIRSGGRRYPTLTSISFSLFAFMPKLSASWKFFSSYLLTNFHDTSIMEA